MVRNFTLNLNKLKILGEILFEILFETIPNSDPIIELNLIYRYIHKIPILYIKFSKFFLSVSKEYIYGDPIRQVYRYISRRQLINILDALIVERSGR